MLIVFAGLPGVGKTTVSRAVAARLTAAYLRIDAIEQAIRDTGIPPDGIGAAGYAAAQAVAEGNLALGRTVVADCVNPVQESRDGWRAVAARAGWGSSRPRSSVRIRPNIGGGSRRGWPTFRAS